MVVVVDIDELGDLRQVRGAQLQQSLAVVAQEQYIGQLARRSG